MTRFELLHLLVGQARSNGFDFRKWYTTKLGLPWESAQQSVETLSTERRYYWSSHGVDAKSFAEMIRGHWGIENV